MRAYSVPAKELGAFRGRLGHLQKQGLLGSRNRPGKGQALVYGPDQFHRFIFACECFELGFSRATVIDLVAQQWERRLRQIFKDAEDAAMREPGPNDTILVMSGIHMLSAPVPNIDTCQLGKLIGRMHTWMRMGVDDPLPARAIIVNLSARLRTFHRALADLHFVEIQADKKRKSSRAGVQGKR